MSTPSPFHATIIPAKQADEQLRHYLRQQIPDFKAPTGKQWIKDSQALRKQVLQHVVYKGIPASIAKAKPKVVWGDTIKTSAGYSIRKLRYEIYPDYWIPAVIYLPNKINGKAPVMINPNGHTAGGKAADYKQARCANLARRGVIALNFEFIGMGELFGDRRHNNINHLNFVGVSGVGLFYMAMSKGLDICLALPKADKKRVGVTGLSGGGWQSIFFGPLDPRVTLCVPVAGYTAIKRRLDCDHDLGDSEQTPTDLATIADYDTLTAMLAPTASTLIIANAKDECCFRADRVKPVVFDPVMPTFKSLGREDHFEFYTNHDPGTHNYLADNRARLYKFLNKHWGLNAPEHDTHTDDEIFPAHDLEAGLDARQESMLTLAHRVAMKTKAARKLPRTQAQKEAHRQAVAQTIRLLDMPAPVAGKSTQLSPGVSSFILKIGALDLPVVRVDPTSEPTKARIVLSDTGRTNASPQPLENTTQFFVDLTGLGELSATYLIHLVIASVGQRTLGLQTAQLLSVARWVQQTTRFARIEVAASGVNAGLAAITAAAMEPTLFSDLYPRDIPQSLVCVLDAAYEYGEIPSVLCFGLFETTDVRSLKAIADGVTFHQAGWDLTPFTGGR